jgi:prepilin-type processing-associated H-X9-DG protein
MEPARSRSFPLLEVVVVVVIVLLLLGLLLPAMQGSGPSRRTVCQNNMRMCMLATLQYADIHRQFPGYANVIGGRRATWVVPILPMLERNDLYQNWRNPDVEFEPKNSTAFYSPLEILICPDDERAARTESGNPLSYVVNSGSARTANDFLPPIASPARWVEDVNSGVFFNRARADYDQMIAQPNAYPPASTFAVDKAPVMTPQFIAEHDGATYTLMMSENLQAANWATDPLAPTKPFQSEFQMRQSTACAWFVTGQADNAFPPTSEVDQSNLYDAESMRFNGRKELEIPLPVRYRRHGEVPNSGGLAAARPSSNHSGGVNVAYCGGNCGYLSEEIDYRVYTQLMTPNGAEAVVDIDPAGNPIRASAPAGTSPSVQTPWLGTLDESKL